MNTETLIEVGLTEAQAKAYIYLVKQGSLTPPALAQKIGESRSNTYKVLDRLVEMKLAHKVKERGKFVYRPENPIVLETQARAARDDILRREKQIKDSMPTLLNYFYTYSEQPGIRFFQGKDGIRQVFEDIVRTGQTQYLLRSPSDLAFYDQAFFARLRAMKVKAGIETVALTPKHASANQNPETDKQNKMTRTWLAPELYTANVEWSAYGDKVAIISYGEEAMATIIESPQIAESFRQMFDLMKLGADSH